ncbi:MAG TPA: CBS domain-containing protein [Methanomassiliicoccales archaeon]|nr:CBS domain-containing protein [Methanomassiliicoccales archaeon]
MKNDVREILVQEIMSKRPRTGSPDMTVQQAAKLMRDARVGSLVIIEDKTAVGILTERDLVNKVVALDLPSSDLKVERIMSAPLITVTPNEKVSDAARLMANKRVRRLPVCDGKRLVGILTENDILRLSPALIEVTREWSKILGRAGPGENNDRTAGYCELCGGYSIELKMKDGQLLCRECSEENE